jgi:3D (Asp-Asp-Asp) domain-containing protein
MAEIKRKNEDLILLSKQLLEENRQLINENNVIIDDNIALQNSLKLAASVGIKPQNYKIFEDFSSENGFNKGSYIGSFLGTAYTPSVDECGNNKGITNSGEPIIPGISIAIDKEYWPFGTIFYIKGLGYAIAMDTGSAVKGKYRFDFAVFDKEFAKALGSREWDVYLVRMGNGKVEGLDF